MGRGALDIVECRLVGNCDMDHPLRVFVQRHPGETFGRLDLVNASVNARLPEVSDDADGQIPVGALQCLKFFDQFASFHFFAFGL